MMKRILLVCSVLALIGGGCLPGSGGPTGQTDTKEEDTSVAGMIKGNWKIRTMKLEGASVKNVSDLTMLVSFDGQKLNGRVCNSMSGDYTVNGIVLKASAVMMTKMFCAGDPGKAETAFTSALTSGFMIEVDKTTLTLTADRTVFVLDRE